MERVPEGLDWKDVVSSNVARVAFEENAPAAAVGDVLVEFASGGVYRYAAVPRELFEELLAAESVGRFVNAELKGGEFGCERLEPLDDDEDDQEG